MKRITQEHAMPLGERWGDFSEKVMNTLIPKYKLEYGIGVSAVSVFVFASVLSVFMASLDGAFDIGIIGQIAGGGVLAVSGLTILLMVPLLAGGRTTIEIIESLLSHLIVILFLVVISFLILVGFMAKDSNSASELKGFLEESGYQVEEEVEGQNEYLCPVNNSDGTVSYFVTKDSDVFIAVVNPGGNESPKLVRTCHISEIK